MPLGPYPTGGEQLRGVFQYLQEFGFQDFFLPAMLIFVIVFGILQRIKLFKTQKPAAAGQPATMVGDRKINSVLAIVISLGITIPHVVGLYPPERDPIILISGFLPATVTVLAALFVVLLLLGLAGAVMPSFFQIVFALVATGFLIVIFLMNIFPAFIPTFDFLRDPAIQALIIVLLTMGLVGWWVIRPEGGVPFRTTMGRWIARQAEQPPAQPAARPPARI